MDYMREQVPFDLQCSAPQIFVCSVYWSPGEGTTSQAKQPPALKVVRNENINDICSSCSDFKSQIASASATRRGRIAEIRVRRAMGFCRAYMGKLGSIKQV